MAGKTEFQELAERFSDLAAGGLDPPMLHREIARLMNLLDSAGGLTGPPGADGKDGAAGPAGADGADGLIGPTGPPGSPVTENVYYVGKHGNDSNGGRSIGDAFLTFGAAASAAPDGATIVCLDGGTYTEDVVIEGPNLLAPMANFVGTGADGTIALQLGKSGTISNFVLGTVTQVGNQTSRNFAVRLHGGNYQFLHITHLHLIGDNLTGVVGLAKAKIVIGSILLSPAAGANRLVGIDPRAPIDIEIGRILNTGFTSGCESWGIYADHSATILTGHIGVYQDSLFPGQSGGLLRINQLFAELTVDYATGSGFASSLGVLFRVAGGNCIINAGFLSGGFGDVYNLSSNQLRIFSMFIQGPTTHTGGTLVAKQLSDIP